MYYLNRLRAARKYPVWQWPAVAGKKARQKFDLRYRRWVALRGGLACSERHMLASAGVSSRAALRATFANRSGARFFLDALSPAAVAARFSSAGQSDAAGGSTPSPYQGEGRGEVQHGRAQAILNAADAVCRHEFDLLGSGPVALGPQIDWHRDFKSGHAWNAQTYYRDFDWSSFPPGADIKVPWELSRFQHAVTLGQAYWLAQALAQEGAVSSFAANTYAREFVAQFLSWCDANPVPFGVNWICTMDVAIRIVNVIWGYFFFRDAPAWTDEVHARFVRSLIEHGDHILANPEKPLDGVTSNHYLSDLVGLVYLGVLFPQLRQAREWRAVGVGELVAEMDKQVHRDGADYESSISYHRLVVELFTSAALLCRLNGVALLQSFWERLERMFEFTLHYARPDGHAPQIGDVDDGRLHILANYGTWDRRDHRHLLGIGAVLFGRDDFAQAAGEQLDEAFWLCGEQARAQPHPGPLLGKERESPHLGKEMERQFAMRNAQFAIPLYLAIVANPVGTRGVGNHKHNDLLSFELYAGDKAFIVDPGTYLYTPAPEWRNRFRATAYHNTMYVDGEEQNRFDPAQLFLLRDDAKPRVHGWESTPQFDFFDGEHSGYQRLAVPITHRRQIYFDKCAGFWVMRDLLSGSGPHRCELHLHFAPLPITLDAQAGLVAHTQCATGTNLAVVPLRASGWHAELTEGWVSCSYGTRLAAPVVCYWTERALPAELVLAYWPFEGEFDAAQVRVHAAAVEEKITDGGLQMSATSPSPSF